MVCSMFKNSADYSYGEISDCEHQGIWPVVASGNGDHNFEFQIDQLTKANLFCEPRLQYFVFTVLLHLHANYVSSICPIAIFRH